MTMVTNSHRGPWSVSGHPITGDRVVRQIYLDEAGTSSSEPNTVVVGVIVNADLQWHAMNDHLQALRDKYVPEGFRDGFVFHAKDIFAGKKPPFDNREEWPMERRLEVLKDLLKARSELNFPVAIGSWPKEPKHKPKKEEVRIRHLCAYAMCMVACEKYLREFADPSEVSMLFAENHHEKKNLTRIHEDLQVNQPPFPERHKKYMPITKIVDGVHFVKKKSAPLLQYADVAAFATRRYFDGLEHGDTLFSALKHPFPEDTKITCGGPSIISDMQKGTLTVKDVS